MTGFAERVGSEAIVVARERVMLRCGVKRKMRVRRLRLMEDDRRRDASQRQTSNSHRYVKEIAMSAS
ncbi:hypothetical protein P9239_11165 [Caballeronia sp. LZ062]|uniref:hypothetical protein n=1 Tax=unclassified Caballeronia TaxID=2646786 RepID=UPI0028635A1F|nr:MULTISPECIES: hypothetical protein [unclassified Caballeronia]MDR5854565.1 hypothetical protein [Caballeronia sp. LZ050]MDR5870906.1 hypothetical protein [Caballeronia sp. LZ062]